MTSEMKGIILDGWLPFLCLSTFTLHHLPFLKVVGYVIWFAFPGPLVGPADGSCTKRWREAEGWAQGVYPQVPLCGLSLE